jgi:hypothetical protein
MSEVSEWRDDELLRTAHENRGLGADAGLQDDVRFRAGVVRVIRRRVAVDPSAATEGIPALFFLLSTGPPESVKTQCESFPMLDNGLTPIGGRLWFVSPAVALGKAIPLEVWDDAEVFRFASDELEVGDIPAILFESRTPKPGARYYPAGLDDAENYEELTLSGEGISLGNIFDVIDTIHAEMLVTPEAQARSAKLWEKPLKHWVSSQAEDRIQTYLRTGLTTAFPSCTIRPEQIQTTGRLDLEIEEPDWDDPSNVTRHAILELKVLRSYRSTGTAVSENEVQAWVTDGVNQAASYCAERGARLSALCCFDMRVVFGGEGCFAHVRRRAKRLKVALRVWHLFATSKAYREARTAADP